MSLGISAPTPPSLPLSLPGFPEWPLCAWHCPGAGPCPQRALDFATTRMFLSLWEAPAARAACVSPAHPALCGVGGRHPPGGRVTGVLAAVPEELAAWVVPALRPRWTL